MTLELPDPATRLIEKPWGSDLPGGGPALNLIISVASSADTIGAWGPNVHARDRQLREFWPTEPYFASALYTVVSQYVAFEYTLSGPARMTGIYQDILNNVQFGKGWQALMTPFLIDLFTQDNGAFIEIVRADNFNPRSPVISLNHLDSQKCFRTGDPAFPVYYQDNHGTFHRLAWYNVIAFSEMPSPVEEMRGVQYCALTRVLRATQTLRDVGIVKQEKASGRFTRQVNLVSGVQTRVIEDAMRQHELSGANAGFLKYIQPLIIASLDPTARVTKETIDLASIPDDYDEEKSLRTYILLLSMAFGQDYQTFAPLPGGGLGSSSQSKVLNMKSRGKGPGLFMRAIERLFNFHGLLPRTVSLSFTEKDAAEQMEQTELRKGRAEELEILIRSGLITTEVGRQIMVDRGDLDEDYLVMMREENQVNHEHVDSTQPHHDVSSDITPGMPGPKEPPKAAPPAGAVNRPPNSNAKLPRNPATNQKRNPGGTPEGGARA